jgi:hypothetical protein
MVKGKGMASNIIITEKSNTRVNFKMMFIVETELFIGKMVIILWEHSKMG